MTGRQSGRTEITVFVWESDGNKLFAKSNFTQFVNRNVKILGERFYSPSSKDVAWLEDAHSIFEFSIHLSVKLAG